jgi:hypothetical protein
MAGQRAKCTSDPCIVRADRLWISPKPYYRQYERQNDCTGSARTNNPPGKIVAAFESRSINACAGATASESPRRPISVPSACRGLAVGRSSRRTVLPRVFWLFTAPDVSVALVVCARLGVRKRTRFLAMTLLPDKPGRVGSDAFGQ